MDVGVIPCVEATEEGEDRPEELELEGAVH